MSGWPRLHRVRITRHPGRTQLDTVEVDGVPDVAILPVLGWSVTRDVDNQEVVTIRLPGSHVDIVDYVAPPMPTSSVMARLGINEP